MPIPPVRPTNIPIPFSYSGTKNTIPVEDPAAGPLASYEVGFPAVTMIPVSAGGQPPFGKDFNGLFFDITSHTLWVNAGGQYLFDAALSTEMGGYPAGMVLQSNDGLSSFVSAVANNTTDFNSTPASIGTLWLPWAGRASSAAAIATVGGVTVLTATQYGNDFIFVTGVLAADATLTFPAKLGRWTVINNTTGAFIVTAIAAGGAGVPLLRGKADTIISDGTNVMYENASAITQAPGDSTKAFATTEFATAADLLLQGDIIDLDNREAADTAALYAAIAALAASSINTSQLYFYGQL